MDLFSLVAKLTLDANEYDDGLEAAEQKANSFTIEDPELGLENEDFKSGIEESETLGSGFGETMKGVFNEVKGVLVTSGIVAAVTGVVSALKEGIELAKNTGDAIDKQSQKLNLSKRSYQELNYAMELCGASVSDLSIGMRNFTAIKGGEITEDQAKAFEKLKINVDQATDAEDLMIQTLYKLADYQGEDRGLLTKWLFGRNSEGLNALLNSGSDAIKQMRQEANDLGLIMTDEEVANAAAYMDATTRLKESLDAIKTSFAKSVIPLLTSAADKVAKIIAFFNPRNGGSSLSDIFGDADKSLAKDLVTIEGTSNAAMDLVDKLFAMGDAEKLTAEQQAEWKSTAEWLVNNIPSLSEVIDLDTGSINGNKDAIMANVKAWGELERERAIAEAKEKKYKAMLDANSEAIDKQAAARAKAHDAAKKEQEMIAEANRLLKENSGEESLAEKFSALFGTDQIDRNAENLQQMLDWMGETGYQFADTGNYQELTDQYLQLQREQASLTNEANKFSEQLSASQTQYTSWCEAIDELYGATGSSAEEAVSDVDELNKKLEELPDSKTITIDIVTNGLADGNQQAKGNWNVPYDNYPSLLHRGEMVLSASQARKYRDGESGANTSAIVSALQGLRNDLTNLQLVVGRKTFGRAVVNYGGNRMSDYIGGSESRLAAGYGT